MVKSGYNYISETFQKHDRSYQSITWDRLIKLRHSHSVHRVKRPTNLSRARKLGYKAKQGYIIVRSRIRRGTMKKIRPKMGRKPQNLGVSKITPKKSLQRMAEERSARKFPNLEVLNSYFLVSDGTHKWFEVIMVDPNHPQIIRDPNINWIGLGPNKRRTFRSLTSAGKKGRGLKNKGIGSEKLRPSLGKHRNRGK
ncbi:MAG: 50S ribosomal protein L15e [Promethearchaeota archaeon]